MFFDCQGTATQTYWMFVFMDMSQIVDGYAGRMWMDPMEWVMNFVSGGHSKRSNCYCLFLLLWSSIFPADVALSVYYFTV